MCWSEPMQAACGSCMCRALRRRSCCRLRGPFLQTSQEEGSQMSIATKRGDAGQTSLAGAVRVSKGHLRVEAYGTVDEINSALGLARSIADDPEIRNLAKSIQRELFAVGSALATAPGGTKPPPA